MKAFAILLLCVFVSGESRSSSSVKNTNELAKLGEQPWFVHLRKADYGTPVLASCAASLIHSGFVLGTAHCLGNYVRHIWLRYGTVNLIHPSLVTETNAVHVHPGYNPVTNENNIAMVQINKVVLSTEFIAPVILSRNNNIPESTRFCAFGETEDGGLKELMNCFTLDLEFSDRFIIGKSKDGALTKSDIGAPLVKDGIQYGLLVEVHEDGSGYFQTVSEYVPWIEQTVNIILPTAEESSADIPASDVKFIN